MTSAIGRQEVIMDDELTNQVLQCQRGEGDRGALEHRILLLVWEHLKNYRRHDEDDISGFLVHFLPQVGGLVDRFRDRGVPFHHFVLRTVRWRWTSWQSNQSSAAEQSVLLSEPGTWTDTVSQAPEELLEGGSEPQWQVRSPTQAQRLVLLTLKSAPYLQPEHVDSVCSLTGVDREWLELQLTQACRSSRRRLERSQVLADRQAEAYWKRLVAEDRCRKEPDPERRELWEQRAQFYRQRLARIRVRKERMAVAPTHLDLSKQLGIPKGTVDSALYHLKKELSSMYSGGHDRSCSHEQPPQKRRTRKAVPRTPPSASP